jgi:hypothetical protein
MIRRLRAADDAVRRHAPRRDYLGGADGRWRKYLFY